MKPAPLPPNESQRIAALKEYAVLDTEPERAYDDLTRIATEICGVPVALVSLIDTERQWFKSKVGIDATQTPREIAFCAHAILGTDLFLVPDATRDERFRDNPIVTGEANVRFYAGTPLINPRGYALGTLCVVDRTPRQLTAGQAAALEALGRQIVAQLELRRANLRMKEDLVAAAKVQQAMLPRATLNDPRARFAWVYRPCDELGGDLLNVFKLDDNHVGFYVLDVSGHGAAAALLSVTASHTLQPHSDLDAIVRSRVSARSPWRVTPPARVAAELCRRFEFNESTSQYFTLLYGVIDLSRGRVSLVSAGHPGPVLAEPGKPPRVLPFEGLPIGFSDDTSYTETTLDLRRGDRLILYSDGVTEAANASHEQFDAARLLESVDRSAALPLSAALGTIADAASRWANDEPQDDISLVAMEME